MKSLLSFQTRSGSLTIGKKAFWLPFIAGLLMTVQGMASDLVNVSPITNKILLVYIEDGHIDYHSGGQRIYDNVTYYNPTDTLEIYNLGNYQLSSNNDGNYSSIKSAINVGRKSKGIDYNDEWSAIPFVLGHWIYVELPYEMQQGKSYTLHLSNLVENTSEVTFTYDVNKIRSEAVHVNMVGFPQQGPKYAYLSQWMGDFNAGVHTDGGLNIDNLAGNQFRLINYSTGQTAYSGTIAFRLEKEFKESYSGDFAPEGNYTLGDVWECDFTNFTTPGEYVVAVDGMGCSYPFKIGNETTKEPFFYAMKGLFWQRQGVFKENIDGSVIPRDHHPDDVQWKWDQNWFPGEGHSTSGFSAANVTTTTFTLNWSAATDNIGVAGYEVYTNGVLAGTTSATTFNLTGLSASAPSEVIPGESLKPFSGVAPPQDTQAPSVPNGLASSNITENSFSVSWNSSSDNVGVTDYEVFNGGNSLGTTTATNMNISGLTAGTHYLWIRYLADDAGDDSIYPAYNGTAKGIYLVRVFAAGELIKTEKVIIQ